MFYPISAYFWGKVGSNVKNGQILKFKEDLKEFNKIKCKKKLKYIRFV